MKNVCRWMEQGMYARKILEQFNNDELFALVLFCVSLKIIKLFGE